MASSEQTGTSSPSVSSSFLPLNRQRRSSVMSVASTLDKDTLNQALDNIHRAASCSDALTTFNEFAAPPSKGNSREGLGITGDIQGSLNGFYNRIKASVGVSKEGTPEKSANADGADDNTSIKSGVTVGSSRAQVSKYGPGIKRRPDTGLTNLSLNAESNNHAEFDPNLASATPRQDNLKNSTPVKPLSTASSSIHLGDKATPAKPSNGVKSFATPKIGPSGPTVAETTTTIAKGQPDRKSLPSTETLLIEAVDQTRTDAIEALKATDPKTLRPKLTLQQKPGQSSTMQSDLTSESDDESGLETAKPEPMKETRTDVSTGNPLMASDKLATHRGSNNPKTREPQPDPQKMAPQPRMPILGLVRGHSATSTAVSTISTTRQIGENEDEIAQSISRLPTHLDDGLKKSRTSQSSSVFNNFKKRVLSREYWMRDENAKDCFYCGDSFSAWRRKHHCRTCGQIFDAKCTTLVNGTTFGQSGSIRVCLPCEGIINGHDDSSEFSDDASISSGLRPRHGSSSAHDISPARSLASLRANAESKNDQVPSMTIPTRRIPDDTRRRAIVEIDAEPRIQRPGSARSFKPSLLMRSHTSCHKRHHSKNLLQRNSRMGSEDPAFFNTLTGDSPSTGHRLSAFHSDSVIDPDLAAYLSDDGSSENEQVSLADALSTNSIARNANHERNGLPSLNASSRKRSRFLEKSISGITLNSQDADNVSISSARLGRSRSLKHRTPSISSNLHLKGSPRVQRYSVPSGLGSFPQQYDLPTVTKPEQLVPPSHSSEAMVPSQSNQSSTASAELNNASLQHVKGMLSQLLKRFKISNARTWEKALFPIILQASNEVTPDVQHGDAIDIRHYIKLKKIAGGRPTDCNLVPGLVFTKNLALKSMPRHIPYPNILILTFPLEYARHQKHFMSLEPVIRQEREYLHNLIHRIAALKPNLLLVHQNVSGLALQFLEEAGIATAYNVKLSVLEAISRCAQTRVITSIDKLAIKPAQAGRCAAFYLKTYKHKDRKKTYMFLSGCPKELGCTIVIRGGDDKLLGQLKKIAEFMIYVAYNLKLETSFMRDEFAQIPTYQVCGSIEHDQDIVKRTDSGKSGTVSTLPGGIEGYQAGTTGGNVESHLHVKGLGESSKEGQQAAVRQPEQPDAENPDEINLPDDTPMPTFYGDMIDQQKDRILSCSPFVRFKQPYLVMRAREQERRLVYLRSLRDKDNTVLESSSGDDQDQKFMMITPDMIHGTTEHAPKQVREVIRAVQDAEYDKAVHNYRTQKKQWEAYVAGSADMFDPLLHQNLAVLYTVICATTSVPCVGPDVLALGFYNEHETDEHFDADVTLGQYIEDLCLGANNTCGADACGRKMLDHHRQYVHGEAQLSITVEPHLTKLNGFDDVILMWSICRNCGKETPAIPMSDNTWKYSFGKYLELSFWGNNFHARAGGCSHDLHRDYHRFFGFKNLAVRVQYDAVTLLEIIVPRTRITWKVTNDLKFKNEAFTRIEDRINRFMLSVKARVKSIRLDSVLPEKSDECKDEVDRLNKLSQEHHTWLVHKLQEKYVSTKYYEIVPFNRIIRALQEKVVEWDGIFESFEQAFLPSDKDIRRLATLQLKKIFLDREDSMTSLSSTDEKNSASMTSSLMTDPSSPEEPPMLVPATRKLSLEKTTDMLNAVVEDHLTTPMPSHEDTQPPLTALRIEEPREEKQITESPKAKDIEHLDLAVPEDVLERKASEHTDNPPSIPEIIQSPTSAQFSTLSSRSDSSSDSILPAKQNPEDAVHPSPETAPVRSPAPRERASGIPRATDLARRKDTPRIGIPLFRAQSQPAHLRREKSSSSSGHGSGSGLPNHVSAVNHGCDPSKPDERRASDRAGLGPIKSGINTHSMIPRSVINRKKDSKVHTLAKHFEELSREFERERLRDRRQRASKIRQMRAYPVAAPRPIIEEYRNVHEAVAEKDNSDEQLIGSVVESTEPGSGHATAQDMALASSDPMSPGMFTEGETTADETAETTENEDTTTIESRAESESDDEGRVQDSKQLLNEGPNTSETQAVLNPVGEQIDLKLDLPKHEKSSLMKMLTNFWAERSASGWQPLEYPLNPTDHIFADSDIIVREDEPSSLIAFALGAADYKAKLKNIQAKSANYELQDKEYVEDLFLTNEDQSRIERSLLVSTGTHLKYEFQEGSAKMLCKIFYAEQFEAVRRKCGIDFRFIESLSRCLKWDSKGGKTKSVFLKTLDDRLVLKSLSQIETQAFLRFAPSYFTLMGEALFHELPSVIAKMVGFYQIVIKNPATGVEFNWFLLVMENLFYDRTPTRIFDLKGSMRNRRIQSTGERNEVLLDENMVEYIYEKPLFAREHSKRLLRASVYNDTLFLARQNVMDYSLMIAIDEQKKELVVGIIDCIRTYTWDKKLESWMKDRGKNRPTVTSPKEYKNRFREAMSRYVLQAPTYVHSFSSLSKGE